MSYLVLGNSERAAETLPEFVGKVRLACTSPPYSNAISYTAHSNDPGANYRDRPSIDYADYLEALNRVWDATWSMLQVGGVLAVNAGTVLDNGVHTPLPQDILNELLARPQKWSYVRTILWNKVTAGVKRAGSVIQHPYPGYWHPNIMTEHIVLVRKGGSSRHRKTFSASGTDYPPLWNEDIWDLAPVPPRQVPHPAPFPEEIPHRLIRMLSNAGDVIMDPFNGAGATTKAARDLGRTSIGFDLDPKYRAYAAERLTLPSAIRAKQLEIRPVLACDFEPRTTRGKGATRHGAGLATRKRPPANP
jgi:site-specific DNA-methyltransferase (adenine-specific)